MPQPGDRLRSSRSTGKYVREAIIISYNAEGHVLYNMLEHWGNPQKGKLKEFVYRPVAAFNKDYGVCL